MYKIGEFARLSNVSVSTLRNWDKNGKLTPVYVSDGGTRFYSENQLRALKGAQTGKQLIVVINTKRENLTLLMNEANEIKNNNENSGMEVDVVLINNNMESAVFYTSDVLEAICRSKVASVVIYTESDNFISRLIRQFCVKSNIIFEYKVVDG
jgi:predicted site-specific integrase-resolvase